MNNLSSNRQTRLLYFVLNIVFLIPLMLPFSSILGIIAALAILSGGFVYFVVKAGEEAEAYAKLIKILFMDTLICGVLVFLYFFNRSEEADYMLTELIVNINPMISIFVAAYVLSIFFKSKNPVIAYIVSWVSLVISGYILCVSLCTVDGNFISPEFIKGGAVVLNIYLIFSAVFSLCSLIVVIGKVKNFNILMFSISFLIFFFVLMSNHSGILNKAYEWEEQFGKFTREALLWAEVLIVYGIVIISCFTLLFKSTAREERAFCFNINVLLLLANAALLYKFAMSWYTGFNYLLVYLYVFAVLFILWQDMKMPNTQAKTYGDFEASRHLFDTDYTSGLGTSLFIMINAILFLLSIWMFKHNMWVNALIILIFTVMIRIIKRLPVNFWIYLSLFVFLEALGLIFQFKLSLEIIFFTIMIFIAALAALLVLNLKNPNGFKASGYFNMMIIVLFCILNFALVSRHGSKINVYPDGRKVGVVVEAIGSDNEVDKALIYWTDAKGEKLTEESEFTNQIESDVHGACMHIETVDSFGIVSKKTAWFPYWTYIVYEQ